MEEYDIIEGEIIENKIEVPNSQEIEEKILHRFYYLKDQDNFNKFFGDYDFNNPEDKIKVEVWEKIIRYLLEDILECFTIKVSDLIKYTKIKNEEPKCLKKILPILRKHQIYLLKEDIYNDKFYKYNFPELYPPATIGNVLSYLNPLSYIQTIPFCREEANKDNNEYDFEKFPIRKDLSENEMKKEIPENSILFNYQNFQEHCKSLLIVLKEILNENDTSLIIKKDFITNVDVYYTEKNNPNGGKLKLRYGTLNIDESIHYLEKTKKIIIFPIDLKKKKIYFIKVAKDKDDSVNEEDKKKAKSILNNNEYYLNFE